MKFQFGSIIIFWKIITSSIINKKNKGSTEANGGKRNNIAFKNNTSPVKQKIVQLLTKFKNKEIKKLPSY